MTKDSVDERIEAFENSDDMSIGDILYCLRQDILETDTDEDMEIAKSSIVSLIKTLIAEREREVAKKILEKVRHHLTFALDNLPDNRYKIKVGVINLTYFRKKLEDIKKEYNLGGEG